MCGMSAFTFSVLTTYEGFDNCIVEQSLWIVPSATCLLANSIVLCWNAQPAYLQQAVCLLIVLYYAGMLSRCTFSKLFAC